MAGTVVLHDGRDGPRVVSETISGRERQVLERRIPAAACVDREARNRRIRARVLCEDVRNADGGGQAVGDAVVQFDERTRRDALPARQEESVAEPMTSIVDELPCRRDRANTCGRCERLSRHGRRHGRKRCHDRRCEEWRELELHHDSYEPVAFFRALSCCSTALSIALSSEPSLGGASNASTTARSEPPPRSFSTSAATLLDATTTSNRPPARMAES